MKASARTPVERATSHEMRAIGTVLRRELSIVQTHLAKVVGARTALDRRAAEESERFGRPIPPDPDLLDLLASIDITEGDRWLWRGGTNNKGVPTTRFGGGRHERTVVRVLAEQFGIVAPATNGVLYPLNGRDDVNPFHRRLRAGTNKRMGNPDRYSGQMVEATS